MPTARAAPLFIAALTVSACFFLLSDASPPPDGFQSQFQGQFQGQSQLQPQHPVQFPSLDQSAPLSQEPPQSPPDPTVAPQPASPPPQPQLQPQPPPPPPPSATNATKGGRKRILASMAREFILAHNVVRAHYREPLLKWDNTLGRYARRWANQRAEDCKMIHSYGPYGENIFWGGQNHWTPTDVVESWAKEHKFFLKQTNQCVQGHICGHYTQIVWWDTRRLGCARVNCKNGGMFAICSYDPPGNYINENPFETKPLDTWDDYGPTPIPS